MVCVSVLMALVEITNFVLSVIVSEYIIKPDLAIPVTSKTLVGDDTVSDNGGALLVSSYVSVIGKKFDLILSESDVESCHSFSMAIFTESDILSDMEIKVSFLNV